jgi:hypothetical protein
MILSNKTAKEIWNNIPQVQIETDAVPLNSTNEYIPVSADTIPVPVPVVVVTTVPVTTTTTTSADTVPVNKISKNLSPYVLLLGVAVGTIILTKILKNEKG